ncbi:hypothetical protein BGZ65_004052, partial [Modicella reniformis]
MGIIAPLSFRFCRVPCYRHPGIPDLWKQHWKQHHPNVQLDSSRRSHCHCHFVSFSFILRCHPCRACLDILVAIGEYWESTRFGKSGAYNSLTDHDAEDDHAHAHTSTSARRANIHHHDDFGGSTEIPEFKYIAMTSGILFASYLMAITVSELGVVLSIVGSTCSLRILLLQASPERPLWNRNRW